MGLFCESLTFQGIAVKLSPQTNKEPQVNTYLAWGIFNLFVLAMLYLDLAWFQKTAHEIKLREALGWSAFWIVLALLFNAGVWHFSGRQKALEFLTGYLLEKSLSVDNLFVFLLIFSYFKVKPAHQHKVLFWGILGALVMRTLFIFCGVALLHRFEWIIYLLGAVLIYSGFKLFFESEKEITPEKNIVLRLFKKCMPVAPAYAEDRFILKQDGRTWATPLLIVLLVVETTDIIFAMDSIPAILSISHDPFIVYTSNVFAILGLRALYFALAGVMGLFRYLHYGLGAILIFVGVKMAASHFIQVPTGVSLAVIASVLTFSVIISILLGGKEKAPI